MKLNIRRLALALGLYACVGFAAAPAPRPAQAPEDVVRVQLAALRDNDRPEKDAGIATVFAFASPSNRAQTGPLERFARMIHRHYADLLGHREAHLFKTQYEGGQAIQPVEILSREGVRYRYLFILRRYDLPQGRCWLTDSVLGRPADAQRTAAWTAPRLTVE